MNPRLIELFNNHEKRTRFARKLPEAFDMVRQRMPKGNPAVGILREHVIIGYFISEFGEDNVSVPEYGNRRSGALRLFDRELLVKTRTKTGPVKVIWTADTEKVQEEIEIGYSPEHDLLLIYIHWEKSRDSVFYIPVEAQESVFDAMDRSEYLKSNTGTNNRGIEITRRALSLLERYENTISINVDWTPPYKVYPKAWTEWVNFWGDP